ncbi:MAG: autorepressor SdpR family transcription factor [Bacteroidia bacterium]
MNLVFKALNDHTRRAILDLLREKDMTAGEIGENFNMSAPSISHHLELLKRAELITGKKKGQFIHYSLNTTVLDDIMHWMMNLNTNKKQ